MDLFLEKVQKIHVILDQLFALQLSSKRGVYPESFVPRSDAPAARKEGEYSCLSEVNNRLVHILYTEFYKQECTQIHSLISEIISEKIYPNEYIRSFLEKIQHNLQDNRWDLLEENWLEENTRNQDYIWNFGPIEAQSDKLYQIKRFFTSVLVKRDSRYDSLLGTIQKTLPEFAQNLSVKGSIPPGKIHFILGNVIAWGGETKNIFAVGWSRPERIDFLEKYGSIKQVYLNNLEAKIEQFYIPMLSVLFTDTVLIQELTSFFREKYFINVILHEFCHTVGKFPGYRERMTNNYVTFEEARADFTAYLFAQFLESQGVVEKGFLRKMVLANTVVLLHMLLDYQQTGRRKPYASICHLLFDTFDFSSDKSVDFQLENIPTSKVLSTATQLLEKAKESTWEDIQYLFQENSTAHILTSKLAAVGIPVQVNFP